VLEGGRPVKGKTVPGFSPDGSKPTTTEGYTVVLNRGRLHKNGDWLPILLHKLTHAVDPMFDADSQRLNPARGPKVPLSPLDQYRLVSEQRAFTAMWTGVVRKASDSGDYTTAAEVVKALRLRNLEFEGFCCYNDDLLPQVRDHIRAIHAHSLRMAGE
jgi:hypothetical protein